MDSDTENKIKKIFCEVLGVSESAVSDDTAYNSFEPWDSLKHLRFIGKIEGRFDIEIELDDIIAMGTFRKIKKIIEKYLVKQN